MNKPEKKPENDGQHDVQPEAFHRACPLRKDSGGEAGDLKGEPVEPAGELEKAGSERRQRILSEAEVEACERRQAEVSTSQRERPSDRPSEDLPQGRAERCRRENGSPPQADGHGNTTENRSIV